MATSIAELIDSNEAECLAVLSAWDVARPVREKFLSDYRALKKGDEGIIKDDELEPPPPPPDYDELAQKPLSKEEAAALLDKTVVLKVNGGLGTGMKVRGPKSEITVKDGLTFNRVVINQVRALNRAYGVKCSLHHLTSFNTDAEVAAAMEGCDDLVVNGVPSTLRQHVYPKLDRKTLRPVSAADPRSVIHPNGHGDIFASLYFSGALRSFLHAGKEYLAVSNVDNLCPPVDPIILRHVRDSGLALLMLVAKRTAADRKGGYIAKRKSSGRLVLREKASAPKDDKGEPVGDFGDWEKYNLFNTNSIVFHIPTLLSTLEKHGGILPLPFIANPNRLDPSDAESTPVFQIEYAMGCALGLVEPSGLLRVPPRFFAPVKHWSDLLGVASDAWVFDDLWQLKPNPERKLGERPNIQLSSAFGSPEGFASHVRVIPSLVNAERFEVCGDVCLQKPLIVEGVVTLRASCETGVELPSELTVAQDCEVILEGNGQYQVLPKNS